MTLFSSSPQMIIAFTQLVTGRILLINERKSLYIEVPKQLEKKSVKRVVMTRLAVGTSSSELANLTNMNRGVLPIEAGALQLSWMWTDDIPSSLEQPA